MFKVDDESAITTQPTIPAVGPKPNSYFTDGDDNLGIDPTKVPAAWLNSMQNEVANVITGAGITLNKASQNQLFTAITQMIATATANYPTQLIYSVTQNGHGFTKGQAVYKNGSVWNLAIATSLAASFSPGIIYEVVSTNIFKVIMIGRFNSAFTGMTSGQVKYLSTTVAGALQNTRPNTDGTFIRPMFIADSATDGFVLADSPLPYASGGGGGGDLLAANNLDDLDDIPTARDNLGLGTAALADSSDFATASALSTLSSTVTSIGNDLDTLETQVTGIAADLSDVQSDISGINTTLSSKASTTYVDTADANLQSQITAQASTIGGIQSDIESLQDDISDLTTDLSNYATIVYVDDEISAVQDAIDAVTASLSDYALTTYVDGLVSGLQTDIDTLSNDLNDNYYTKTETDSLLDAISSDLSDFETDVAATYATITSLTSGLAGKQPLDTTLTNFAALTIAADKLPYGNGSDTFALADFTSFARTLLDDSDASTMRTTLGLVIGTNVQGFDATLAALAALTITADSLIYGTGTDAFSQTTLTSFARTLLDDTDASSMRTTLGLVIGTNVQAYDATLASIAGLGTVADRIAYTTGTDTWAEATLTSYARTLIDDADASTMRTTLGLVLGTDVQAFDASLLSLAALATAANKLPYATGVDTYAETDFTAFARTLLDDTDATTMRSTLGLIIGTNVLAYDASINSLAALATAANKLPYATGVDTYAETDFTAFARTLLDDADASTMRTTLGLVIGTNVQAFDATLLSIAALGTASDKIAYTTGVDTWAETALTSFARTLIDDADATTMRSTLGLVIGTNVQAFDATLLSIAALGTVADRIAYTTATDVWAETTLTSFVRTILDDTNASGVRGTIGIGPFTAYAPLTAGTTTTAAPTDNGLGLIRTLPGNSQTVGGYGATLISAGSNAAAGYAFPPAKNMLFNGAFNICQRYGDPYAGLVTIAVPASTTQYTADRWQFKTNANQACTVKIGTIKNESTFTGGYNCPWIRLQRNSGQTGTGVLRFCQTLTREQCATLNGISYLLSFSMAVGANFSPASGNISVKVYTGTATTDMSGIGAGFTGNVTVINSTTNTAGFKTFTANFGDSSSITQIAVEISWTPVGTAGANDYIDLTALQFEIAGGSVAAGNAKPAMFEYLPQAQELARCQYFYRKSFNKNTAPAQNVGAGSGEIIFPATSVAALTNRSHQVTYPPMRTNDGTITIYNPAATNAQARDETVPGDCTSTAVVNQSDNGFAITTVGNASTVVGNALAFHYAIDNELN